jgi:hypothetical protein
VGHRSRQPAVLRADWGCVVSVSLRAMLEHESDPWVCVGRACALADRTRADVRLAVSADMALVAAGAAEAYRALAVTWLLEAVRRG